MKLGKKKKVSAARSIALNVLRRVEAEGAFAPLALNHALRRRLDLSARDRALTTELVYGTLRWRRRLDFALATHSHRSLDKVEPSLLRILRLSAYQLMFLDRVPAWAAVDQGTELAAITRGKRAAGFVNGVLRGLAGGSESILWPDPEKDPIRALGVTYSYPDWLAERWLKTLGMERTSHIMEASNRPAPLWVRANTLRAKPDEFASLLTTSGHRIRLSDQVPGAAILSEVGDVTSLSAHQDGWFHVQDGAAQAVCHLLDVAPGQRVLDGCGAPGGKTATLAQLMGDQGEVLSADVHPARVGLIHRLVERLGIHCVTTEVVDLTDAPEESLGTFDRILLDAPCSSLGVLRRHPERKWKTRLDDLKDLTDLQRQLLDSVAGLLKPGGYLVYSVCTPIDEEGPGLIRDWLTGHLDFQVSDPREDKTQAWHSLIDDQGALSSWPDLHDMDAFYAVRLKRNP